MSWPSAGVSPTLRLSERREASLNAQSDVRGGERERERRRVDDASPALQKVVATAAKPGPLPVPLGQSRSPSPGPRPVPHRSSCPSCSPCGRPHGPPPTSRRQSRFAAGYSPAATQGKGRRTWGAVWGAVRLSTHTARSLPAQTRHSLFASLLRLPEGQKSCCRASARVRCQAACAAATATCKPDSFDTSSQPWTCAAPLPRATPMQATSVGCSASSA